MTAQQSAKLNMYNAVIKQLTGESTAIATVPALKKAFDLFVAKVAAINSLIPGQGEGSTGESLTKAQAKSILAGAYADLAQQVYAWAADAGDAVAQQKADLPISNITRLKDSVLPSQAEDFYTFAVANKAALLEFGVTDESLESFAEAVDNFSEAAALPRNKISTRSTHVKNMTVLFTEADKLLNEQIKNTMVALKKKYPDVYTTFINNCKIVDAPSASAATKAARAKKKDTAVPQL